MLLRAFIFSMAVCCFSSVHAVAQGTQGCGTSIEGGNIEPGDYAGTGDTPADAEEDLEEDLGVSEAACEECPVRGCTPDIVYDQGCILFGVPHQDPVTGNWVIPAEVSESCQWDTVCTSCT